MLIIPTRGTRKRGFSLIEAAIVLGLVGLVIGGIWVAASAVNSRIKMNKTLEQLSFMAQCIGRKSSASELVTSDAAKNLVEGLGCIPADMTRTPAGSSNNYAPPLPFDIRFHFFGDGTVRIYYYGNNVDSQSCNLLLAEATRRYGNSGIILKRVIGWQAWDAAAFPMSPYPNKCDNTNVFFDFAISNNL